MGFGFLITAELEPAGARAYPAGSACGREYKSVLRHEPRARTAKQRLVQPEAEVLDIKRSWT